MICLANIFVILTIVTIGSIGSSTTNIQLLKDYTDSNDITVLLFVSCDNELLTTGSIKYLQRHGLWTNVLDISNEVVFTTNFDYRRFFERYSQSVSIVINLECNQTKAFMGEMSKRIFFHHERKWFLFSENLDEAFDILNKENVNFDAEIALTIPVRQEFYDVYEVYNPSFNRGGRLNILLMGNWSAELGWKTVEQTKIERRRDLNGTTFSAVIPLANIPKNTTFLEHLNSNELVHLDSMSRYMYRLFVLMTEMFNFSINLRLAQFWGMKDTDGNWKGAVGALNRSQVDFCITGLRWADERYGVYEQTTAAYYAQFLFIFRHPKSVESLNVFLSPFNSTVWLSTFALAVCSAFVARQIFSVENEDKVKAAVNNENINENSYSNSVLMIFGFIFQQGYNGIPMLLSSRVLVTTILIFSLLIFQFYSSFIVGSLLTVAPKNIKTVKQLLNSRFEFGVDVVPYVLDNFHSATEESTVKLYEQIMKNPGKALMPLQTGLSLVKNGGFVFNTDGSYAYHVLKDMLTDSEKCDLQDIIYLPKQPVGPGVENKSPFRELVKISIRKFSETGILAYNKNRWYGVRPKCEVSELIVEAVDIAHFSSALYILVGGMLTSAIVLVIEVIFKQKNGKI